MARKPQVEHKRLKISSIQPSASCPATGGQQQKTIARKGKGPCSCIKGACKAKDLCKYLVLKKRVAELEWKAAENYDALVRIQNLLTDYADIDLMHLIKKSRKASAWLNASRLHENVLDPAPQEDTGLDIDSNS